jgi:predicted Rossmann fold nucleotide-binding protein DprA/Smf involved in DNA uptake
MIPVLSPNTQVILLITAPLIAGRGTSSSEVLSPGEYKRFARLLREMQRQPSDLLSPDASDLLRACQPVIEEARLQRLLGRGFMLSQAIERWQARAIWVVSRADAIYPRRLKTRLREDAPAVLYGCGDINLLENGGLAVVGSRHADEKLIDYTMAVGRLAARSGKTIVSGGAKGIDQAAMRGALEEGGKVIGVLADSLEKTAMKRDQRNLLMDGQLVLISPYDPNAGFNVGNAMQRKKVIYALADASLVMSSDLNKGGTWTGATEQLDKLKLVPVYVRLTGNDSEGLNVLHEKGAIPWPNPQDVEAFNAVFDVTMTTPPVSTQPEFGLLSNNETPMPLPNTAPVMLDNHSLLVPVVESLPPAIAVPQNQMVVDKMSEIPRVPMLEYRPADILFATVRESVQRFLTAPMKDAEVAAALEVSSSQAKAWLDRLVEEGMLEKLGKPVRYVVRFQSPLLCNGARKS